MDTEDGITAVRAARAFAEAETMCGVAEFQLSGPFLEKKGVFVTISKFPSGDLRGCIGYPEPIFPIKDALRMAAEGAINDPRFTPLTSDEAEKCTFEVTILTVPEEIEYSSENELISKIVIGRDGLIISYSGRRGLLLPQVPLEFEWDVKEYLEHLSMKAGLPKYAWKEQGVKIESFQGEIFSETSPRGDVVRK